MASIKKYSPEYLFINLEFLRNSKAYFLLNQI